MCFCSFNVFEIKTCLTVITYHDFMGSVFFFPFMVVKIAIHLLVASILDSVKYLVAGASLVAQSVKNPPAMQEMQARSLGREGPLE